MGPFEQIHAPKSEIGQDQEQTIIPNQGLKQSLFPEPSAFGVLKD